MFLDFVKAELENEHKSHFSLYGCTMAWVANKLVHEKWELVLGTLTMTDQMPRD